MKSKNWVVSVLKGERLDVHRVHFSKAREEEAAKAAVLALVAKERGVEATKGADVQADATEGYFK